VSPPRPPLVLALACALACTSAAPAAFQVSSTSGGSFIGLVNGIGENGGEYWDNGSYDGSQQNVGYFLTKTGAFASNPASPAISAANLRFFAANATGAAPLHLLFGGAGAAVQSTQILIEVAGFRDVNRLSYVDQGGIEKPIFAGPDGPGATATFTAVGQFALILRHGGFFATSDSSRHQFFSVFHDVNNPDKVYIGIEDLKHNSDVDYNDMVITLQTVGAPAPSALVLLASGGLSGLAALRRTGRRVTPAAD
jgi:hypothetical protein